MAFWSLFKENPTKYAFIIDFNSYFCYTRDLSLYLFGEYDMDEQVEKEDKIGVIFANIQLNFMKALASGEFSKTLAE